MKGIGKEYKEYWGGICKEYERNTGIWKEHGREYKGNTDGKKLEYERIWKEYGRDMWEYGEYGGNMGNTKESEGI